jgi:uncharacterized membrane protein
MKKIARILEKPKTAIMLALFLGLVKFILGFSLINSKFPGGVDVSYHLFTVWYIATYGITKWNYFWYGCFPFLRYYPPLAHLIVGFVGRFFNFLITYKFFNNLFMGLAPIAFFYFLKEFNLPTKNQIIALIFFSFVPIYSFYLADGRYTTIINFVTALAYWIFLKRSLDKNNLKNILLASVFLSFSILTSVTTTFMIVFITFFWAMYYRTKANTFCRFFGICMISLLLTAWWSAPFVLESFGFEATSNYANFFQLLNINSVGTRISSGISTASYFTISWGRELIFLLIAATFVFCSLSFLTLKDKITKDFLVLIVIMASSFLFVNFLRMLVFLPIPISILLSQGISVMNKKLRNLVVPIFFLLLFVAYFSIRPQTYPYPKLPSIPKDGRVLILPVSNALIETPVDNRGFQEMMFSAMNGNENIFGWAIESQRVGEAGMLKSKYNSLIQYPMSVSQERYYELLKDGWVNYLIVNKTNQDLINYFNSSEKFKIKSIEEKFIVFEIVPKSTYVELNGNSIDANITKKNDEIDIDMKCEPGIIKIKESFHKNWVGSINKNPVTIELTDNGFMQIRIQEKNDCSIKLSFEDPKYYFIFDTISFVIWLLVAYILFLRNFEIIKK